MYMFECPVDIVCLENSDKYTGLKSDAELIVMSLLSNAYQVSQENTEAKVTFLILKPSQSVGKLDKTAPNTTLL